MPTALAIRHVHFEDVGLLGEVLTAHGYDLRYLEAPLEPIDPEAVREADLLVVLGGPIGVYDDDIYPFLTAEVTALRQRLRDRRPTLGICLGAQLMARALDQPVYPSGIKEIGWAPLSLTTAGQQSVLAPLAGLSVLHWHGDTFDLPAEAELLASTELVRHQAFRIGSHALGLQFHLEAQPPGLEAWYVGHAGEIAATPGLDVPELRRQAATAGPLLAEAARKVFDDWLRDSSAERRSNAKKSLDIL